MKSNLLRQFLLSLMSFFVINAQAQTFAFDTKVVSDPRVSGDHIGHHGGNSIFGDYMVGGGHYHDYIIGADTTDYAGIAYLFHWNDSTCHWDQIDVIEPEGPLGALDIDFAAEFGFSVALENDLIAIGARRNGSEFSNPGNVYIYRIVDDEAVFVELLVPYTNALTIDSEVNADFGVSLKMHGGQLIVGATQENQADGLPSYSNAGAAYIYEWDELASSFVFQSKLTAGDRYPEQNFGNEVSIYGNHAVVAAQLNTPLMGAPSVPASGAVYVFEKNPATGAWTEIQKIAAFDRGIGDFFGASVDMTQQHIIVGAPAEDPFIGIDSISDGGSAYIYKWNDVSAFDFEQKINSSDFEIEDQFGFYVAISEYSILVGAPFHDLDEAGAAFLGEAGAAYLFQDSPGGWVQTQKLDAFDRRAGNFFGESLSIHQNRIMVGSWSNNLDENGDLPNVSAAGAIYIFTADSKPIINDIIVAQEGVCTGIANLTVNGVLYDAYDWEWHEGSCDGPLIGTGESIEVNPTETTTYCIRAIGCFNYIEPVDCECVEVEAKQGNWHQKTAAGLYETGNAIATDSEGNVYIAGIYQGYAVFDGGDNSNVTVAADPSFTSVIKSYVAKYDNCANLMWVAYAEGNGADDYSNDIVVHESGDYLFIVGEFENQITFNHGIGDFGFGAGSVTTARAGKNGYIARLSMTTGKVDYVDAVWSDGANSNLTAIAINENNGKIIVAGQTYNTFGQEKVFIRKYNPSYSTIGPKRFHLQSATYNGAIVNAIDYDEDSPDGSGTYGSFWLIGDFRSTFYIPSYFGAPFTTLNSSGSQRDAFVIKYYDHTAGPGAMTDNPTGVFLKKGNISFGPENSMTGMDIAIDPTTGNAYMTGTKKGDTPAAFSLAGHDLPVAFERYTGYFVSMRFDGGVAPAGLSEITNIVSPRDSYSKSVTVIGERVYFSGSRTGNVYFDIADVPGSNLPYSGLAGDYLMYIVAYNALDGSFQWANGTTNPSGIENAYHYPNAILSDNLGHLFVTGSFIANMGYMIGTPSSGNLYYSSNGGSLFTMRVDVEGAGEMAFQKPVFGDPKNNGEVDDTIQLVLIPNPTTSYTQIKLVNSDPEKIYALKVVCIDGRIIYESELRNGNIILDCSTFANGIYTVWVMDETITYSVKLLKTN